MVVKQAQADSVLNIHSKRDLTSLSEVSDYKTGKFLRFTFTYVGNKNIAWVGRVPGIRKYDLTVEDLKREL